MIVCGARRDLRADPLGESSFMRGCRSLERHPQLTRSEGGGLRALGAKRFLRLRWILSAAVTAMLLVPAAASAAGVPNPVVWGPIQGGIRGFPANASTYPLSGPGYDYIENEYFFSGTATDLSNGETAPYVTRMVVRMPADPKKFNGIMLVDWPNVTDQEDFEFTWWAPAHQYLMQQGYGYAMISAQQVGVNHLKAWDPERYALLLHPGDSFAQDIFAQGIQALRDPQDNGTSSLYPVKVDPTGGVHVKYVVAGGVSQSASELATFINNGYNRGEVDAYNIERDLGSTYTDFSKFIFSMDEETSFTGQPAAPRQPNNPHFVVWEEAGASHEPISWWEYRLATQEKQGEIPPGSPDPVNTTCSVNRAPIDYRDDAMLYWTRKYLATGAEPPSAPRIERTGSTDSTPVRDANGLVEGGLRDSFIQVPVALNTSAGCPFWGTYMPWSSAKIEAMYPTHANYVSQVTSWDNYEVSKGWLLPQDSDIATAKAFNAPWLNASCYDTSNQTGNEIGPLSSQIAAFDNNPTLMELGDDGVDANGFDLSVPLGGVHAALHDVNCDVVVPPGT
jgi:hypothetical protein